MKHVVIPELAHGDGSNAPTPLLHMIPLSRRVYGVAIGTDSELDQCMIQIGNAGPRTSPWPAGLIRDGVTAQAANFKAVPQTGEHDRVKIGVGGAWVASEAAPIREQLIVIPSRACLRVIGSGEGVTPSSPPRLTLDLAETPSEAEAMLARIRRAPLDVDFSLRMNVTTAAADFWFPTYGRSWWSCTFNLATVSGSGTTIAWQVTGITEYAQRDSAGTTGDPDSVGSVESSALASGATASGSVEGDSAWDRTRLRLTLTGGTLVGRLQGHFRAEDL